MGEKSTYKIQLENQVKIPNYSKFSITFSELFDLSEIEIQNFEINHVSKSEIFF